MPFHFKNFEYGLPHEEYPKKEIDECLKTLSESLHLKYEPVAVTFLFTKEDYDAYPAGEIKAKAAYCVMVKQAATLKNAVKCRLEQNACDGATTALALEPSTDEIESGRTYFSYKLYSSAATARRMRSGIKSLHRTGVPTYGMAIVPLSKCEKTPDVIISVVNAYQAMRYVQGYEYRTGLKPQIDMGAMQAMCSELTVVPYVTASMNVSVFCPSTRMLCKWEEDAMGVGIPFELFEEITEGVVATTPQYE